MKTSRESLFAQLEPPPHGAERMAARLASGPKPTGAGARRRGAGAAGAAAAVLALVALAALVQLMQLVQLDGRFHRSAQPVGGLYAAPEFDRLLGREVEPYKLSVSLNQREVRVVEVPTSDPKIRVYALQK